MNNAIETIMSFINENTTILILICVFLIIVLMIYLIETSIKSRRIQKNIEEENRKTKELVENHNLDVIDRKEEINKKFVDGIIEDNDDLEKSQNIFDNSSEDTSIFENVIATDLSVENESEELKEDKNEENKSVDVIYKNDKKLSEILFSEIEKQPSGKLDDSIVKKDEEIEKLDSAGELEEIMKKLNDYDYNNDIK